MSPPLTTMYVHSKTHALIHLFPPKSSTYRFYSVTPDNFTHQWGTPCQRKGYSLRKRLIGYLVIPIQVRVIYLSSNSGPDYLLPKPHITVQVPGAYSISYNTLVQALPEYHSILSLEQLHSSNPSLLTKSGSLSLLYLCSQHQVVASVLKLHHQISSK